MRIKVPITLIENSTEVNPSNRFSGQSLLKQKRNLRKSLPSTKVKTDTARKRRRRAETKGILSDLTELDSLTSLPNRKFFHQRLQQVVQITRNQQSSGFALLILGLDRFREINHTLGFQQGDWLLREVARRFESVATSSVVRARLGGDEFAAVFPGATRENIATLCATVLRSLASPFVVQHVPIDLSGSIGVALYPEHGADANLLFQRANIALDLAKQSGRRYTVYDPTSDPYGQKMAYLGSLRNAIEQEQLMLYYQPKIDLRTRRTHGVEALVRWNHPKIGLIPPYQFISVAERTGLMHALTQWVLKTALDQCSVWRRAGFDVSVAINLSPRDFHDDRLPSYITGLLKERGLPATYLELEITESVIMAEAVHVSDTLSRLSKMGVCAYIDDFGTGYSSLGLLKKLPVAGIKIDKSFVSQMMHDDNDAVIVRSTIELGHNLGLNVVAEGVESLAIWHRLTTLGCDVAQGYHMSRPKPASEFGHWFAKSPWGMAKTSKKAKRNRLTSR
jgi:diguanylate cyclase